MSTMPKAAAQTTASPRATATDTDALPHSASALAQNPASPSSTLASPPVLLQVSMPGPANSVAAPGKIRCPVPAELCPVTRRAFQEINSLSCGDHQRAALDWLRRAGAQRHRGAAGGEGVGRGAAAAGLRCLRR